MSMSKGVLDGKSPACVETGGDKLNVKSYTAAIDFVDGMAAVDEMSLVGACKACVETVIVVEYSRLLVDLHSHDAWVEP